MNICSNQIKEVILHRFKVNSLQKLLIHINFLLAFSVLFCSHSAFGQPSVTYNVNLIPHSEDVVDLGLDVYWAKRNVGANTPQATCDYFAWSQVSSWNNNSSQYAWGGDWRTPKKEDLDDLCNTNKIYRVWGNNYIQLFQNTGGSYSSSSPSIIIPVSGFYDPLYFNGTKIENPSDGYFWTSTKDNYISWRAHGMFLGMTSKSFKTQPAAQRTSQPIRPVIDKIKNVKLVAKYSDGTPISSVTISACPKGTPIETSDDDCYTHKVFLNNETDPLSESEELITENNATYTVVFTQKAFTITTNNSTTGGKASISPSSNAAGGKYLCGTPISLTAKVTDDCYTFDHWKKDGTKIDGGGAILSVTVSGDATYEAIFSIKTTNIRATTDSNKGWVGLNVWK